MYDEFCGVKYSEREKKMATYTCKGSFWLPIEKL